MQGDIVAQGLELMLYGMGTVVVFLTLLVFATTFMSRLVGRYFPEPEVAEPVPARAQPAASAPGPDGQLVAAITAAIHQHRSNKK